MDRLPVAYTTRLQKILTADNFHQYLTSLHKEKVTCFRVNTLKIDERKLIVELHTQGILATPITWLPTSYFVAADQRNLLTNSSAFHEGLLYIQNPASQFASLILAPNPGEEVLDLAAAPGGKTLHIATLMQNQGRIAAVEAVRSRFFKLLQNIKQSGTTIVQTYHKDGSQVGKQVPNRFDRVLLDAPCSSEGRFDIKDANSYAFWSEKKIAEMSRKQKKLIYSAVQSLKSNGILIYCTCSFAPEENEAIIQYALDKFKDQLEVLPFLIPFENFQPGLTNWEGEIFSNVITKAIRIIPDEMMSGFFICKLRKK